MLARTRTRLGRLEREVSSTSVLNHIVVEPLLAALCDPLIAARLMIVHQMERGGHGTDGATTSLRSRWYASHYSQ